MLAVLPNAPAMIHLSKSRQSLLNKRNRLLKQLYGRKIIDSSTYELAISEPLPDEPHPLPQIAPHLVSRFYPELLNQAKFGVLCGTIIAGILGYVVLNQVLPKKKKV